MIDRRVRFLIPALTLTLALALSITAFPQTPAPLPEKSAAQSGGAAGAKAEELPPLTEKQQKFVAFIGGELLPDGNIRIGDIIIHRREREVSFPAMVNLSEGDIEVAICTSVGKTHESLLVTGVDPFKLQLSLILLGLENGAKCERPDVKKGDEVSIEMTSFYCPLFYNRRLDIENLVNSLSFHCESFPRTTIDHAIIDSQTGRPFGDYEWTFVGSSFAGNGVCVAALEGTVVDLNSNYNSTCAIISPSEESGAGDKLFQIKAGSTPPAGTLVTVYVKRKNKITDNDL